MKQGKTYGNFCTPHRGIPVYSRFFSLFSQKKHIGESPKTPMFSTCSAGFATFTFTGKERDEETGYGYFGARYMDHELMTMWLNVDPMADKYPSISPYAYCAWNPMKLVDPDGRDIWEIDNEGNVVNRISDNTRDIFYIVDDNGNRNEEISISFDNIIISSFKSNYNYKYNCTFDSYEINGDENGQALFEFLSDNTCVEWSHFLFGEKELDECNYVTTSHLEDSDRQPLTLLKQKKEEAATLRRYTHSHPNGDPKPSGTGGENGDLVLAKWIIDNFSSNVIFSIYTPGRCGKYHTFTKDYVNELRTVVIDGNKKKQL